MIRASAVVLWLTSAMVQIFLVLTLFSKASYLALIAFHGHDSVLYEIQRRAFVPDLEGIRAIPARKAPGWTAAIILVAALATIYCLWLLYAAGLKYLLLSALLYAPGAVVPCGQTSARRACSMAQERVVPPCCCSCPGVCPYARNRPSQPG